MKCNSCGYTDSHDPNCPREIIAMCVQCRSQFSEQETEGASACPKCGATGLPADPRHKGTLTLTHHEWRILFMWADWWAQAKCGESGVNCIAAIRREAHRQMPGIAGGLSLTEDVQEAVNEIGTRAEIVSGDGERTVIEAEKKH